MDQEPFQTQETDESDKPALILFPKKQVYPDLGNRNNAGHCCLKETGLLDERSHVDRNVYQIVFSQKVIRIDNIAVLHSELVFLPEIVKRGMSFVA